MKTINKTCTETLREAWHGLSRIARHALRQIERMSWPVLLVVCIMLALLITLLPLALTLFALFLVVKLISNALGGTGHPPAPREHQQPEGNGQ